jgi:3-hydroxy-3-methylglutaryl CoA synthase
MPLDKTYEEKELETKLRDIAMPIYKQKGKYMYTYIYMYMYLCVSIYIYIYICIYIYTCRYILIYTHIYKQKVSTGCEISKNTGNTYTASVYMNLAGLVSAEGASLDKKSVVLFSYGSGAMASMFNILPSASGCGEYIHIYPYLFFSYICIYIYIYIYTYIYIYNRYIYIHTYIFIR